MNRNVKIAKELVRLAKSLIASKESLKSVYDNIQNKIETKYPGEFSFYYHNGHKGYGYHSLTCKPKDNEFIGVLVSAEGDKESRAFTCTGFTIGDQKSFKCKNENEFMEQFAKAYEYAKARR